MELTFRRKFKKVKLITLAFTTSLASLLAGCASTSYDTPYTDNSFYTGGAEAPKHPPKAHNDFFNKVCTPSGADGREYSCHYED